MKRLFSLLSSIRFLLPVLGILGLVSLIGVIIPQDGKAEQYANKYGSGFAAFLMANGWHHVFSSIWFIVPLALLCLNLLLCVVKRCISLIGFVSGTSREAIKKAVPLGALGSLMLHAGLIFLVTGGIIQYYRGETQMVLLAEGEKQPAGSFPFSLALRYFTIDRNADSAIVNYRSGLDLIDPRDSLLRSGETKVNGPLSWKHFSFYQTTYGYLPDAFKEVDCAIIDTLGDTLFSGALPFRKPLPMSRNNCLLLCDRFECDFVLDIENRTIGSRSLKHNNPAFHFTIIQNDTSLASQWIFLNQNARRIPAIAGNIVVINKYVPACYSGIEVRKKAGTGFIWTGLISVSLGLLAVFLFPMRPRSPQSAPISPKGATAV
jgi:hypothetical protein